MYFICFGHNCLKKIWALPNSQKVRGKTLVWKLLFQCTIRFQHDEKIYCFYQVQKARKWNWSSRKMYIVHKIGHFHHEFSKQYLKKRFFHDQLSITFSRTVRRSKGLLQNLNQPKTFELASSDGASQFSNAIGPIEWTAKRKEFNSVNEQNKCIAAHCCVIH